MTERSRKKRIAMGAFVLITLGGMGLRLASCFWGYPMALHPDEFTIVDNAIDMLRRHSCCLPWRHASCSGLPPMRLLRTITWPSM